MSRATLAAPSPDATISVVLPCLNEVESVADVVAEARHWLAASGREGEVVVVDNGSTDGSAEAAARAGAVVVHERRRGYGSAYLAGFRAARGEYMVMADADGSYDLSALPAFFERLDAGADLVMGSRFQGRIEAGAMPWTHRYIGSPVLSGLLNLLYHTGVSDAHCGMRAFRKEALDRVDLRAPGMEFASEMIVNAARAGLRIAEVPVDYRVRGGASKLRSLPDGWRHLRFLLLYSPTHLFVIPGGFSFAVGMTLILALVRGPLTIGPFQLDVHYMILGALLALLGAQVVALGLYAKTLAVALRLQRPDRLLNGVRRVFTLERGLLVGGALFLFGLGLDVRIAAEWLRSGLGPLDEVRIAVLSLTVMLLGVQLAFSSLFLSAIEMQTRDRA